MKDRRIAFYMHDLSGGGVERMRLALIAELRTRGIDVRLVVACLKGPLLPLLPPDLPVEELGAGRMLAAVLPLARYLRRTRPNVLIASLDHNNITALLARLVSRVSTDVIICQHNALSAERALGWRYRAVPWLYRALQHCARGIVAVSQGVADDLAVAASISRDRITTIYNPVIGPDFAQRAAGPAPHPWLADDSGPVFVFVGRLTHQKDPTSLLDAMALLLLSRAARLIILGDGPLRASLEEQASHLGIADRTAFVGFQSNPLPWVKHAHALVSTSRYEGLGNAIIEAMACGTSVIATDCPHGPSEILLGGQIGILVKVGDVAALARAMQSSIDSLGDVAALIRRSACFTAASCADAHLALLDGWSRFPQISALGLQLTPLRADQVIEHVVNDPMPTEVRLVVTPNLDHVRLLQLPAFATAYKASYFVCPDGAPVLLYARLRGLRLSSRVTGCELFHRLANHPDLVHHRVCVVVESSATAAALSEWADNMGLTSNMVVLLAPPGLADAPGAQLDLATDIRAAAPTILVMTLGAPLSETFVDRHRHVIGRCWALCVGQAVRVQLGLIKRAPSGVQQAGLEWLWRVAHEPRRLVTRYIKASAWFPVAVLRDVKPFRPSTHPVLERGRHAHLG